jgi:PadR family transcriptional regulator, regulatory protein PadR
MDHRDLLSGFIRLHILHRAAEGDLYGQWMIEELARHGYRLRPGTLYPLLYGLVGHQTGLPMSPQVS